MTFLSLVPSPIRATTINELAKMFEAATDSVIAMNANERPRNGTECITLI
jgi:hypothetical protein